MGHSATELMMQCGRDVGRLFGLSPNSVVELDDHGWLGLSGEKGSADFNMCFVARTASPSLVERFVKEITSRDLAAIMIVDEGSTELVQIGEGLGWMAVGQVPVMVWEDGPELKPSDRFDIRIGTEADHEEVCRLVAQGFSLDEGTVRRAVPPSAMTEVEAWVDERDGELVGTGTLIRTDDHVGVYSMATPERNQRQGIGRAVLETAMAHHLASGAKTFTLEATEAGYHLYEQLGYKTVAMPTVLVAGESTQFPG
jgi:N-acetylglutamate synthase-like GNAT family acetyltransferase